MKKLIIIISFPLFFISCVHPIWKREFIEKSIPFNHYDSVINSLQRDNSKLLILYYSVGFWAHNYICIAYNNGKWSKISYIYTGVSSKTTKPYTISKIKLNKIKGDSIFNIFIANKFWRIKDNEKLSDLDEREDTCGSLTDKSISYQLTMVYKKKQFTREYFDPEYWESVECTQKSKDRQIFIACKNAIFFAK